jgi:hypothetical protein
MFALRAAVSAGRRRRWLNNNNNLQAMTSLRPVVVLIMQFWLTSHPDEQEDVHEGSKIAS